MVDLTEIFQQSLERARKQPSDNPGQLTQWHCPSCEKHRGVSCRTPLHIVLLGGALAEDGTVVGGRFMFCCWHCMARGRMTIAGPAPIPDDKFPGG